ncbi:MAG: acetyltransferase [Chloroflexi bacterium]|nr:acetyltransferase [Chloroflexota bacterium]
MEKVVIFGTSAGAALSHFCLTHDSPHEVVAFTVDRSYIKEEQFCGLPVIPFEEIESIYPPHDHKMLVALLANRVNKTRAEKYHQAKAKGYELISYISSKAITWPDLVVGDNCFIGEGSICRPFLKICNDVMIMAGAFLGHDSVIKDHCFIASRATLLGAVTVEPYCCIGANATILDGVTVAGACVIGAGAVIQENTREKGVYKVGPPTLLPLPSDRLENILFRGR